MTSPAPAVIVETEAQLLAEVSQILANAGLMRDLQVSPPREATQAQVLAAWKILDPDERRVISLLFLQPGERPTHRAVACRLGSDESTVSRVKNRALRRLREAIWATHGFPHLRRQVIELLGRSGITQPDQLQNLISRAINATPGWGPAMFDTLERWVDTYGPDDLRTTGPRPLRSLLDESALKHVTGRPRPRSVGQPHQPT